MISPENITILRGIILDRFGLDFPENRTAELIGGLIDAEKELGLTSNQYLLVKKIIGNNLTSKEKEIIANHLTIGETYFFREAKVLAVIRDLIFPELLERKDKIRPSIKIWSAGCSSGEEPYTLAMMLLEAFPDIASCDITIIGTDINQRSLSKAQKGIYTPWSFRETPEAIKKKYFIPKENHFELIPEVKKMVSFKRVNLAERQFPSANTIPEKMDLILCRNVLMYFSNEVAKKVVNSFNATLKPNGWFIPSQVELSDDLFAMFEKIKSNTVFVYRKPEHPIQRIIKTTQPLAGKKQPGTSTITSSRPVSYKSSGTHTSSTQIKIKIPAQVEKTVTRSRETDQHNYIREQANKGLFPSAIDAIQVLIEGGSANAETYYLGGVVYLEQGSPTQAESMFRKALYLDPHHLLSHYQMLVLLKRRGQEKQAKKHFQNVDELLQALKADEPVPHGEGMTAGELVQLLQGFKPSSQ